MNNYAVKILERSKLIAYVIAIRLRITLNFVHITIVYNIYADITNLTIITFNHGS